MRLGFRGGAKPREFKHLTESKPIEACPIPAKVVIPLQQHIGAACKPLVAVGDQVLVGQKIGEPTGFVGAPVHASVSGKVAAVAKAPHPSGVDTVAVTIESDGLLTMDPGIKPRGEIDSLSAAEIRSIVREAGIVGMGGATFPTHVKLSPPEGKTIDTVIINGCECEPFLTADHRTMVEMPEKVVQGLRTILKAVGAHRGIVAIEDNKPDAVRAIRQALGNAGSGQQGGGRPSMEVVVLPTRYPQGAEKQLIYAVLRREVPAGGLPMDVGALVNNVGTAVAIANAIYSGMPLVERVVTVTGGAVAQPKNLLVRLGTPVADVIAFCGGYLGNPGKLVIGGPLMGIAQVSDAVPVIKGTSGILVLSRADARLPKPDACIRCGRCVEACPMRLMPLFLANYAEKALWDEAASYHAMDCIECGTCSFVCPAKRPLVQLIRLTKAEITASRKKAAQAGRG